MSGASQDDPPKDAARGGAAAREVEELAARYLDLWQDQVSALAADPEFAEAWRKLVESFGMQAAAWQSGGLPAAGGLPDPMAALQAMMAGQRPPTPGGGAAGSEEGRRGEDDAQRKHKPGGGTPGAAAAAAAPGGGGADLEQLAARLERIERRLDGLETKPAAKGGGARKRNRKPGS